MIVEKFGEKELNKFIYYLHSKGLPLNAGSKDMGIVTCRRIEENAKDKDIMDNVVKTVGILSPLRPQETITDYEYQNAGWVVAAFLSLELGDMPLYVNCNFLLVKEIAMWRLKINK